MDLTSKNLQAMLAVIFGVDVKYIVPKQGNWWNPQDMLSTAEKPMTWVAFNIEGDKPIDVAHFQGDPASGAGNDSVQHRKAEIVLQLVGDKAHELALTVGHWIHNDVVRAQLALVEGQLFGDVGEVTATDFYQDGANTVKAYNVKVRVAWTSRIPTGQGLMEPIDFAGQIVLPVLSPVAPVDNLEGYWPLEESGQDLSGFNRILTTLLNEQWGPGIKGRGIVTIDRTVARAAYGAPFSLASAQALTISWWCNSLFGPGSTFVLSLGTINVSGVQVYNTTNGSLNMVFYRAGAQELVTLVGGFDSILRHYALTLALPSKQWVLYRDGGFFNGGVLANIPVMPNDKLVLGNYNTVAIGNTWVGAIDEVRIYSRALGPTEVKLLYEFDKAA